MGCNKQFIGTLLKIKKPPRIEVASSWAHLGSNQGPSDYESDALTG